MEFIGAEVGQESEKTEKKHEQPGPVDFLEPDGSRVSAVYSIFEDESAPLL
jgi:hypothetical protein